MKSNNNDDILQGSSIPLLIAKYAVPTVLSQIVTVIYNLADTYFVGHTNDPVQVAALTLSFPLFMSLVLVGNLFGIGANSYISRSLGKGKKEKAQKASTLAFWCALIFTAAWSVVLFLSMRPILRIVGALSDDTYLAARSYLFWTVVIGGVPSVSALMLGHLLRGEGNTRLAGIGIAFGGVINIILDPIFIQISGMGAAGAGLATFISNCASLMFLLICIRRNKDDVIRISPRSIKFSSSVLTDIILVGLPAASVIVLGSAGNIVLTHYMAPYGDISVAAYGIVQKIGTITIQVTVGLTQGIMPLLGYCYGAKNYTRLRSINRWAFFILFSYSMLCVGVIELIPKTLISVFIGDENTVALGTQFLRRWILCAFGLCFVMLFNAIFQAMGKWKQSLALTFFRQGVILIPTLILINRAFGAYGLIWAQPIADTVSLVIGLVMYLAIESNNLSQQPLTDRS